MTATLTITPSESVTIRQASVELLEVEVAYREHGKSPIKHLHPAQVSISKSSRASSPSAPPRGNG